MITQQTILLLAVAAAVIGYLLYRRYGGKVRPGSGGQVSFTEDLTALARQGKLPPVIGRANEIQKVIEVLCRRTKNNPLLLGEPGVGKTAIIEGLANRIAVGDVPETLRDKTVLSLDLGGMISGTQRRGEFEQRVRSLLAEISAAKRRVILFIDEMHLLTQAKNAEGALNISDIMKPALARGELQVVGAATPGEYDQHIRPNETVDRHLQPINVPEPTIEETVEVLRGIKRLYEEYHGVRYEDAALVAAAELSQERIPRRFLPDKAIDVVDEAGARVKIRSKGMTANATRAWSAGVDASAKRQALREELSHIRLLEKKLKDESSLKEVERRLSSLLDSLPAEERAAPGQLPTVTAKDIGAVVEEWQSTRHRG